MVLCCASMATRLETGQYLTFRDLLRLREMNAAFKKKSTKGMIALGSPVSTLARTFDLMQSLKSHLRSRSALNPEHVLLREQRSWEMT